MQKALLMPIEAPSSPRAPQLDEGASSAQVGDRGSSPQMTAIDGPLHDGPDAPAFVGGKHLAIVVSSGSSRHLVEHIKRRFEALGANAELVVPAHSDRIFDDRTEIEANHTLTDKPSTDFDFVVVLPGPNTSALIGHEITEWAHALRHQSKPLAIGAQAAELLGVDIDNAGVFDVSTCDAFVQVCKDDAKARDAQQLT